MALAELWNGVVWISNSWIMSVVGSITTIFLIFTILISFICWWFWFVPICLRLWKALWGREIAIFSSSEFFNQIKPTLIDSKIFKEKNIIHVSNSNNEAGKRKSFFLVEWDSYKDNIEDLYNLRRDDLIPIIIFARPQAIPHEVMNEIANRNCTVVVNFKWRLLNDILVSLITTAYDS